MNQNITQDLHIELAAMEKERASRKPITVIGFYTLLLVLALMMLATLYAYPVVFLGNLRFMLEYWGGGADTIALLTKLLAALSIPFAILFGWALAGLCVCGLLYVWFRSRRAAAGVTLVLAILWIAGVFRHARGMDAPQALASFLQVFGIPPILVSPLIVLVLAVGVLLLPAAWLLRPLEPRGSGGSLIARNLLLTFLTIGWFLACLILIFGFGGYRAGPLLFAYLVMSGVALIPGLYLTGGFLLPLAGKDHRGKMFNYLRDCALGVNFPAYVVVDESYDEDKVEKRVSGGKSAGGGLSSFAPRGPGFVLMDCDHAVAISDGIEFKGVQGPGVAFTEYADQIVQTIDLRPQLRTFPVEALTKDGIKIRVLAFTPFKIDSRGRQPKLGEPLPYNKGAAFKAVHAQRVEHEGGGTKRCKWDELSRMITERVLQDIISEYNFDDLYGPYQPGGEPPRKVIAARFRERVAAELEPLGIQLVGGGISDLEPADPRVYLERARSWQAEWKRKITLRQAEGQAEWLRTVERARAEAQADLILNLGRQLEELSAEKTEFRPEIALKSLLSTLERMMRQQPALGQLVPGETMQALLDIRKVIPE